MTHAISWAAVSTKPQAERESLDDQHRLNHALAEALGWDVLADITVPGESRSYYRMEDALANLDAYSQLKEFADTGTVNWLIVKDRSRLARTRRLNRQVSDYLADHNIRVYSRTMPPSNTSERTEADVWGEAIEGGYSEAEILRLKQRREMGMQARVKSGKMPNTLPWGFKRLIDSHGQVRYEFDDPRAEEAIRFAITRYQAGIAMLRIVKEARERGYKTATGKPWMVNTVKGIVLQPAYYSLVAWGKRRTTRKNGKRISRRISPDQWLIAEADFAGPFTPKDWELTMAEADRRALEHPRRRGTPYWLSGILWCLECNSPMHGSRNRTHHYYRCSQGLPENLEAPYHRHYIPLISAHRQVDEHMSKLLQQPDWIAGLARDRGPEHNRDRDNRLLLEEADALIRRRQRWMDAYEDGAIELADFSERITRLDQEEATLAMRIARLDDEIAQLRAYEERLEYAQAQVPLIPSMLSYELTPSDADKLRKIAHTLWRRITVRDKTLVDFEWHI